MLKKELTLLSLYFWPVGEEAHVVAVVTRGAITSLPGGNFGDANIHMATKKGKLSPASSFPFAPDVWTTATNGESSAWARGKAYSAAAARRGTRNGPQLRGRSPSARICGGEIVNKRRRFSLDDEFSRRSRRRRRRRRRSG